MQEKTHRRAVLGKKGEQTALVYLKSEGFKILTCNYRTRFGEIDIIAQRRGTLYFFEVKSRGWNSLIGPLEALTPAQAGRIRRTAQHYLVRNPSMERLPCSFAVIGIDHAVEPPQIECVLDAFE